MASPKILTPIKDYCLNCEEHKWIKAPATLNNRIGYICVECYNTNIWAKSQTAEVRLVYSQLKEHFEKKEANQRQGALRLNRIHHL